MEWLQIPGIVNLYNFIEYLICILLVIIMIIKLYVKIKYVAMHLHTIMLATLRD